MVRTRAPIWFWIVAAALLLWGIMGVVGFHLDLAATAADRAKMDAYDRRFYDIRPGWFPVCYGIAVWAGLIGGALLLARRRLARALYSLSLIAVVVMFGWMFVATDIIAIKGWLTATGFPVVIALLGVAEVWLAGLAIRRGWIG